MSWSNIISMTIFSPLKYHRNLPAKAMIETLVLANHSVRISDKTVTNMKEFRFRWFSERRVSGWKWNRNNPDWDGRSGSLLDQGGKWKYFHKFCRWEKLKQRKSNKSFIFSFITAGWQGREERWQEGAVQPVHHVEAYLPSRSGSRWDLFYKPSLPLIFP